MDNKPYKEFVGYIWINDEPGIRLSIFAITLEEAKSRVVDAYGEGHFIHLWNEEDGKKARKQQDSNFGDEV